MIQSGHAVQVDAAQADAARRAALIAMARAERWAEALTAAETLEQLTGGATERQARQMIAARLLEDAVARHRGGEIAAAMAAYRRAVISDPTEAGALHMLALIADGRNDHAAALLLIAAAGAAQPNLCGLSSNLERIFEHALIQAPHLVIAGRLDAALTIYRRAAALRPDHRGVRLALEGVRRRIAGAPPAQPAGARPVIALGLDYPALAALPLEQRLATLRARLATVVNPAAADCLIIDIVDQPSPPEDDLAGALAARGGWRSAALAQWPPRMWRRNQAPLPNDSVGGLTAVISMAAPALTGDAARMVRLYCPDGLPLILPFARADEAPQAWCGEDPAPVVVSTTQFAGTNRMLPSLRRLFHDHRREENRDHAVTALGMNKPMIDRHIRAVFGADHALGLLVSFAAPLIPQALHDDEQTAIIHDLRPFQWCELHTYVAPTVMERAAGARFVHFVRDPRDLLVSLAERMRIPQEPEATLARRVELAVDGYEILTPHQGNYFRFPGLQVLTDGFLAAQRLPHVFPLRLEEVRADPVPIYRKLMTDLGVANPALVDLSDDYLTQVCRLGSYEHQTGGAQTDREALPAKRHTWRNVFAPAVKDRVKALIGDALIELGYERGLDW